MFRVSIVGLLMLVLACCIAPEGLAQNPDWIADRPPGDGPTQIDVSFYFMDVMKVDDVAETFEADIFIIGKWHDARLVGERVRVVPLQNIWSPNLMVFNERDLNYGLPEEATIYPDGTVVYRQRLTGALASALDLRRFPLDSQTLRVQLVIYGANTNEVVFVESPQFPASRSEALSIKEWEIGRLTAAVDDVLPVPGGNRLSRLTVELPAKRLKGYYGVQLLVPLLLIVGMSWIVFWLNPTIIPTRISMCVTTVLTLIAYRFMVGGLVPRLPYLTIGDYILFGATLLVAVSLVAVALASALVPDHLNEAERINRVARILHPVSFAALVVLVVVFA